LGIPATQTWLIFDLIYTGKTVPEGIGGFSEDHNSTPQPRRREQEEHKTAIASTGRMGKILPRMLVAITGIVYRNLVQKTRSPRSFPVIPLPDKPPKNAHEISNKSRKMLRILQFSRGSCSKTEVFEQLY
jgi:hypothetical protein